MNQRWKTVYFPLFFCGIFSFLLLSNPNLATQGFHSGLQLCTQTVLPALFPFFVMCELLIACPLRGMALKVLARLFGFQQEKTALALILSWIGGYAVCARLVHHLFYDDGLTHRESNLLLLLGCCSSPGFVIGCVGGLLLGNIRLGILLYAAQIAANLLATAVCLPLLPTEKQSTPSLPRNADVATTTPNFSKALNAAVTSCLQVCGCVLFFRIAGTILQPFLPPNPIAGPVLSALLEISAGCFDFAAQGGQWALYGCCLCLSGLGLSVWAQLSLLLQGAGSLRLLAMNRGIHLFVYLSLVRLLAAFLPGTTAVYSTLASRIITTHRLPWDATLLGFCFVCAALYKVRQNFYN